MIFVFDVGAESKRIEGINLSPCRIASSVAREKVTVVGCPGLAWGFCEQQLFQERIRPGRWR